MKKKNKQFYFNESLFTILKLLSLKKTEENILNSNVLKKQKLNKTNLKLFFINNIDFFKKKIKSISDTYINFLNENFKINKVKEFYDFYKRDMKLWLTTLSSYEVKTSLVDHQTNEDEFSYKICTFYDFFTLTQKTELIIQLLYIEYIKQKCSSDLNAISYTNKLLNILKKNKENTEIYDLIKEYELLYLESIGNVHFHSPFSFDNKLNFCPLDKFKKSDFFNIDYNFYHIDMKREYDIDFISKEMKFNHYENTKIYPNYLNFDSELKKETYQEILSNYISSDNKLKYLFNKKQQYFKYIKDNKLFYFFTYLDILENTKYPHLSSFLTDFTKFIINSGKVDKTSDFNITDYKNYYLSEYFLSSYEEKFNNLVYFTEYLKTVFNYQFFGEYEKLKKKFDDQFESPMFRIMKDKNILQILIFTNIYFIKLDKEEFLKL